MPRRGEPQWHFSVLEALAFAREMPEGAVVPTPEECRRFIDWHSRGRSYLPLTPGLCRLVRGFKNMGLLLGRVESSESWAYGFKNGLLFPQDFMDDDTPDIIKGLARKKYRETMGSIPLCWEGC